MPRPLAAVAHHAARLGPAAEAFSAGWRAKPRAYGWTPTLAGQGRRKGFLALTRKALRRVAAGHGGQDSALLEDLFSTCKRLDACPEVPAMLAAVRALGLKPTVLSNGTPAMLAAACAPNAPLLDAVIPVKEARVFKPAPRVCALAGARLGLPNAAMALVPAKPWDTRAARHAGSQAIRVNRNRAPDGYGLAAAGGASPPDLAALPAALRA